MRKRRWSYSTLIVLFVLLAGGAYYTYHLLTGHPLGSTGSSAIATKSDGTIDHFNILLLGSDTRPGSTNYGNTDTIIVAQIDGNRLSFLSIPRDTRVNIPGHGMDKINAACSFGGPDLTASVVSDLIGEPISKYALIHWSGFVDIVNTLGGVTLDVPRNMSYDPGDGTQYRINLQKGMQHLNGQQALAFVRFRKVALGDIGRTSYQQQFLKAISEQVKQPSTFLKLPWLIPEVYKDVDTNLSLSELLQIAKSGNQLKQMAINSQTLPGYFLDLNGESFWGVDPIQARQVAQGFLDYGQTTDKVVLDTPPALIPHEPVQLAQKPAKTPVPITYDQGNSLNNGENNPPDGGG
jgi:LCP family protein required for cell wall assembly